MSVFGTSTRLTVSVGMNGLSSSRHGCVVEGC